MRILIVEDEQESREGLAGLLRVIASADTISTAEDAVQGLAFLEKHAVDLIFLDIHMPGMDGLDMLRQLRQRYGDLPVVILSAYDRFSYAQQAIHLGVIDYLLKPYTVEAITDVLSSVSRKDQENANGSQEALLISTLREYLDNPSGSSEMLRDVAAQCGLTKYGKGGRLLMIQSSDGVPVTQMAEKLSAVLSRHVTDLMCGKLVLTYRKQVLVLLLMNQESAGLVPALEGVLYDLQIAHGISLVMMMSGFHPDLMEQLRAACRETHELAQFALYFKPSSLIVRDRVAFDMQRNLDGTLLTRLMQVLHSGDETLLPALMDDICADASRLPWVMPQRLVYSLHKTINDVLAEERERLLPEQCAQLNAQLVHISGTPGFLPEYRRALTAVCLDICRCVQACQTARSNTVIKHCLDYLEANYQDQELTQSMVAEHFHFSPGYFGVVFKSATNRTFVQYLRELRINKACRLLADPTMRIYDVAAQTGFADVHYFIRVFSKCLQCSPSQFRVLTSADRQRLIGRMQG